VGGDDRGAGGVAPFFASSLGEYGFIPAPQPDQFHRPDGTAGAGDQLPTPRAPTMIEGPAGGRSVSLRRHRLLCEAHAVIRDEGVLCGGSSVSISRLGVPQRSVPASWPDRYQLPIAISAGIGDRRARIF
jgi:hypothetical protein